MRKNTEPTEESAAVLQVKKPVTKKRARATPSKKRAARPPRKSTKRIDVSKENAPTEGDSNPASSNERSPTPTENGLLVYLTAHITPSGGSIDEHTVFSINAAEYLRGVVRLIHSDCPEVGTNVGSFLESMHRAFIEVDKGACPKDVAHNRDAGSVASLLATDNFPGRHDHI
jgi:hypothetical protein